MAIFKQVTERLEKGVAPQPYKMLAVHQNGFGYISRRHQSTHSHLMTFAVFHCVVLHLFEREKKLCVLGHFDAGLDHFSAVHQILSRLWARGVTKKFEFDTADVLTAFTSSRRTIQAIVESLQVWGIHARVVRCFLPVINVTLFDKEGRRLKLRKTDTDGCDILPLKKVGRRGTTRQFYCENDREIADEKPFEIYRGVPSLIKSGVINMPVPLSCTRSDLEALASTEVRMELRETRDGHYVHLESNEESALRRRAIELATAFQKRV